MEKKDKIVLNLLSSEHSLKKRSTYDSLKKLEFKYPKILDVKRAVAEYHKIHGNLQLSICNLIQIVSVNPKIKDVSDLILLTLKEECLRFIFYDLKLVDKIRAFKFVHFAVKLLADKKLSVNFLYEFDSKIKGQSDAGKYKFNDKIKEPSDAGKYKFNNKIEESSDNSKLNNKTTTDLISSDDYIANTLVVEYQNKIKSTNDGEEDKAIKSKRINNYFIQDTNISNKCQIKNIGLENIPINIDNINMIDCYKYHREYSELINKIQYGTVKEIFNIMHKMFGTNGIIETLELLVYLEKTEILYFLAKRFDLFKPDYHKVLLKISKGLYSVLDIILEKEDENLLRAFTSILQTEE